MDDSGTLVINVDGKPVARLRLELEQLVPTEELIKKLVHGDITVVGPTTDVAQALRLLGVLHMKKVI